MHSNMPNRLPVTQTMGLEYAYKPTATDSPHQGELDRRADQHFMAMLDAYRRTGGLARKEEVLAQIKRRNGTDADLLDFWVARRTVICFSWQSQDWLPWFQFNSLTLQPHPQLKVLFDELADVYEPRELAEWFAEPNPWLAGLAPVDSLLSDLPAVLHAARADRYIANG
jgi:hypothetical protein